MKLWKIPALGGSVLVILVIIGLFLRPEYESEILIVNQSQDNISFGKISVSNQQFEFETLASGGEKKFVYKVQTDAHYDIELTFENGRTLNQQLGYVTHGMKFADKLIVRDRGIVLERMKP